MPQPVLSKYSTQQHFRYQRIICASTILTQAPSLSISDHAGDAQQTDDQYRKGERLAHP
jgi:hypothetical protein